MESKMHLRVVAVSPKDMQDVRSSLAHVFEDLNRNIALDKGFHLDLFSWADAYPRFHVQGPQGAIDESLRIQDCDIVIGLFWARFGTPVFDADSGTEHELRIAYESWKERKRPHIMLYFKNEPFSPKTAEEADQLRKVFEFKATSYPEALYREYRDAEGFKRQVSQDLTQFLLQMPPPTPWGDPEKASSSNWGNMTLGKVPLYTFSGLKADLRNEDLLQDFRIDSQRHENPSPVSYLWADAYTGNSVTARVEEAEPPHLCVTFENKPSSWACNVAIRAIGQRAVKTRRRPILAFEARLSAESHSLATSQEVFVSVRVANGWCQHWAYGSAGWYFLIPVVKSWQTIEIQLTSDAWWLFAVDGTLALGPQKPEFSIISSLVLVFGGSGMSEPGPGSGTVLIRNVHLRERETLGASIITV